MVVAHFSQEMMCSLSIVDFPDLVWKLGGFPTTFGKRQA
jgi:hypothetical protein